MKRLDGSMPAKSIRGASDSGIEKIAVKIKTAGELIDVSESQFAALLRKHKELRAAIFRIPGMRGQRVHVERLRVLVARIAEEQGGQL